MRRAVFIALLSVILAGRAQAFVREVNPTSGAPVFWKQSCVPVTIYLNGFDKSPYQYDLDVAGIVKSITAAAHAWSGDVVACPSGGAPYLEIVPSFAPPDAVAPPATYDGKNSIIFRSSDWPYADEALAHTRVVSAPDGHILDADIEINASNALQIWMNLDEGVSPPASQSHIGDGPGYYDLQNALTHEFGHFIGLAHTCYRATDGPRLDDDDGQPTPDCPGTPAIQATVMYPETQPGETSQRTLSPDETAASCAIYAPTHAHEVCALDTAAPGCAVGTPTRRTPLVGLAGVALLAIIVRRRRRARVSDRARARS